MRAIHGYFDGVAFQPLEKAMVKPNQRVIITIMDDFEGKKNKLSEEERVAMVEKMRGVLSKFAKPNADIEETMREEEGAWARAAVEKYGNA